MTEISKKQLASDWAVDQFDSDNWLVIPDFGVNPADVNFTGFAFPLVRPVRKMRAAFLNIRYLVKQGRDMAKKHFSSLKELHESFIEMLDIYEQQIGTATKNSKPVFTEKQIAAFSYKTLIWSLQTAQGGNPPDRDREFIALTNAAVTLIDWLSGDSRKILEKMQSQRSEQARQAANALHSKVGGSIDKQNAIREIWASGKYTTRIRCAEEEFLELKMSFDTARKALRNTPNPNEPPLSIG